MGLSNMVLWLVFEIELVRSEVLNMDSRNHFIDPFGVRRVFVGFISVGIVALISSAAIGRADELRELDGEWTYLEDRTEGRALERLGPPMSAKFSFRIEEDAVVLVSGHGSGHRNVRIALDGAVTEVSGPREGALARYRGSWENGSFTTETDFVRAPGEAPSGLIRREFRMTEDGLLVRVSRGTPATHHSVAIYRHAEDIPMPTPVEASISDMAWLAGDWVGTRGKSGTTSIEERWSPPLGGSMLCVSRTVSRDRMTSFEYLRIVERDGTLLYIAQPNGREPTIFVLTELSKSRAAFDNPRHDYPKRILYELTTEGALNVSIGFIKGGSPRKLVFSREGN